jgi:transposase
LNPNITIEAIYMAGYLNLISQTMRDMKIPQTINEFVPFDEQCLVSPGEVVQMIVLDILTGRQALTHLEEWAIRLDLEKLLGAGRKASYFNDDAIARHLDRINHAGVHALYSKLTMNAWKFNPDTIPAFHSDTTSKSVYGAYESSAPDEEELFIAEGYSRDRPGAKQIQFGLIVDAKGRPIYGDVHDGNESDKTWNPETLKNLDECLKKINLSGFIYVGDSAAMSGEMLTQVKGAHAFLITRGGNHLKIVKRALDQADQQEANWSAPQAFSTSNKSAKYRLQEFDAIYEGHPVRLIVVESSALDKKKAKTLEKRVNEECDQTEEAVKAQGKITYHCKQDAQTALKQWMADHSLKFHRLAGKVEAYEEIRRPKGRPKKDAVIEPATQYRLAFDAIEPDEEAIRAAQRRASRFVLVTTVPKEFHGKVMDSAAILQTYKGQIRVECNFSILKDPYFIDEIYLKKPHRVEVLGYIFLISLLVYHTIQDKVRSQTNERKPLIATNKRKMAQPTTREIFRLLEYVQVAVFVMPDGSRYRQLVGQLKPEQRRLLRFFGYDESIYV